MRARVGLFFAAFLFWAPAGAAELAAGTVLEASNLERHLEDRFDGTPIAELIPERFRWQIREKGLRIRLAAPTPHPRDARLDAATAKNRGRLAIDPESGRVPGWEAGVPFPDVTPEDPDAARKVMWNLTYGRPRGDSQYFPRAATALVHGERGFEEIAHRRVLRVFLKGLLRREGAPVLGEGRLFEKSIVYEVGPSETLGSGAVLVRYDTGEDELLLTYAHEARKVVRWKGGYWTYQLGMTDFVGDDVFIFNAYPTWYVDFKLLAKKKVLVVANTVHPFWNPEGETPREQLPGIDLETPPHWNPVDAWEPREVYVIEATAPELHPYGRKVLYIDAENWVPYLGEFYARSGTFWKASILGYRVFPAEGEGAILWPTWQTIVDFRRNHGTLFITDDQLRFNLPVDPQKLNVDSVKNRCADCLPGE
ncbi:MAG: DUF1329 domain-containing protein [Alphaproteobacteria bacterium]|nr:DUF1329 domain-containing protein [Alphaproteobacteria bacterium]